MVVSNFGVVVVVTVVHVGSMSLSVGISIDWPVSIIWEEQSVPSSSLVGIVMLLGSPCLVVGLIHSSLSDVHALLRNHCWICSEIRSRVPSILEHSITHSWVSEEEATNEANAEEPSSKGSSCMICWLYIGELVDPPWVLDHWNSTISKLSSVCNYNCKWGCQCKADQEINKPGHIVGSL